MHQSCICLKLEKIKKQKNPLALQTKLIASGNGRREKMQKNPLIHDNTAIDFLASIDNY